MIRKSLLGLVGALLIGVGAAAAALQSGQNESAPANAPAVNMPALPEAKSLHAALLIRNVQTAPLTTTAETDTTAAASDGEHANVDTGQVGDQDDEQQGDTDDQADNQDEGQQGNAQAPAGNHVAGEQDQSDNGQSGNQDNGGD
jgi:hypothetical protein